MILTRSLDPGHGLSNAGKSKSGEDLNLHFYVFGEIGKALSGMRSVLGEPQTDTETPIVFSAFIKTRGKPFFGRAREQAKIEANCMTWDPSSNMTKESPYTIRTH